MKKILFYIEIRLFSSLFIFSYQYARSIQSLCEIHNFTNIVTNINVYRNRIRLKHFIDYKDQLTPNFFRYFLENNFKDLFLNYHSLTPNHKDTQIF